MEDSMQVAGRSGSRFRAGKRKLEFVSLNCPWCGRGSGDPEIPGEERLARCLVARLVFVPTPFCPSSSNALALVTAGGRPPSAPPLA